MVGPRASMLDDERYPIAVLPDEFPTVPPHLFQPSQVPLPLSPVAPSPQAPQNIQPPAPVHNNDQANTHFDEPGATSPVSSMGTSMLSKTETLTNSDADAESTIHFKGDPTMFKGEERWNDPAFDSELLRPQAPRSFWRQFNVWKVLIFGFMAFVTGIVIATVVLNNKSKASVAKATTAAATAATANLTMATNKTSGNDIASVASSGLYLKDGKTWNMQVYYMPGNSTSIMYRMNLVPGVSGSEVFEKAKNMSLAYAPKADTPISATASTDTSGVVYLDVFYITTTNNIAQASLACPVNSSDCRTTSNLVISNGAQALGRSSDLAAVNVDNTSDWRIYYHNKKHQIVELAGNSSGFNTGVTIYSGTTLSGSHLAAVNVDKTSNNINVFFVDHDSKALFYTQFTDEWQTAKPITSASVNNFNAKSKFASAYVPTVDHMRLYYVGTNKIVEEFVGYNASTGNVTWGAQPSTVTQWLASTSTKQDLTSVAFRDQVRWWRYDNGTGLSESALDYATWVENRIT